MVNSQGPFGMAPLFIVASALLHAVAAFLVGLASGGASLLVVGILYALGATGLQRGFRWLAHLLFLVLLFGIVAALGNTYGPSVATNTVFIAIIVANVLAVGALFAKLWRAAPAQLGSTTG